jgi:Protein of Unknown function (DUF2784)
MVLADLVLVLHTLIATFIVLGFIVIPLGAWRGWRFVRHRGLRVLHLAGIVCVAAESLLGIACPLTVWEDALRDGSTYETGFIAAWLQWLLYYDVPLWVFGTLYVAAAVLAVLLWRWIPPAARRSAPPI